MARRATVAQKAYNRLSVQQKVRILDEVFAILEYDEDGDPGSEWDSDELQAIGDLFDKFGVTFTPPEV